MANEPITREEILLNAVATGETANIEPITREEMFLAKLGGADVDLPIPITRKEQFLAKAVESGNSGGGGDTGEGESSTVDALIDCSIAEISSDTVTSIGDGGLYMRRSLVSVSLPEAVSVGLVGMGYCDSLKNVSIPKATSIGKQAFYSCISLESIDLPEATSLGGYAFYNCAALKQINIPKVKRLETGYSTFGYNFQDCVALENIKLPSLVETRKDAFKGCTALKVVDFGALNSFGSEMFTNCGAVSTIILRKTTSVIGLSSVSHLGGTTLYSDGTGYIYVPSALIEDYKVATNWSTFADQFRALEDYTVDGTITGELDPNKI